MTEKTSIETIQARAGDELPETLEAYLRKNLSVGPAESYLVRQFPGGYSNLTYLISFGDQRFVLRRPPRGTKAKTAHDMGREYFVLSHLIQHFPQCPNPLLYCEDEAVLGCPFYVMGLIPGLIIRDRLPANLSAETYRQQVRNMISIQAQLHSLNPEKIGLQELGQASGYVQRQVAGWSKRYIAARTDDAPDYEQVMNWLQEHQPEQSKTASLIHNDFKLDNIVFDQNEPSKIVGVLDWEMATIGDPLMDLGCSLAYWIQADDPQFMHAIRTLPSHLPGSPSRQEQLQLYREVSGRNIAHWDFYYTFGLFRLAVIAQQIYYRYAHGQSQDERFGLLIHGVRGLEKACHLAMKQELA